MSLTTTNASFLTLATRVASACPIAPKRGNSRGADADAGHPQRRAIWAWPALAALVFTMGCGVEVEDPLIAAGASGPLSQVEPCSGVCFDNADQAALAQTQADLDSCAPDADASFENDPEGLTISDIALGDFRDDGAQELFVVVGRNAPQGHFGYPGTRLDVGAGGAVMSSLSNDGFADVAEDFAFGIEACEEFVHAYWVKPDENGEMQLTATVTTDVGGADVTGISFRIVTAFADPTGE